VLAFPGIFRGALYARASAITEEMKLAAADGIASMVPDDDLSDDYIIPSPFNRDVSHAVASAVAEEAAPYVRVMATGRSDYPNQINNVLAFPGIFRGALDVRARTIDEGMKLAAARAIASVIPDSDLGPEYIIPSVFNRAVAPAVAAAVAAAARATGVAARVPDPAEAPEGAWR